MADGGNPQLTAILSAVKTVLLFGGGAAIVFGWAYWFAGPERVYAAAQAEIEAAKTFGCIGAWNWGGEWIRSHGPAAAEAIDQVAWPLFAYRAIVVGLICAVFAPITWAAYTYGSVAARIAFDGGAQSRSGMADVASHLLALSFAVPGILIFWPDHLCVPLTAPLLIATIPAAAWMLGRLSPFKV